MDWLVMPRSRALDQTSGNSHNGVSGGGGFGGGDEDEVVGEDVDATGRAERPCGARLVVRQPEKEEEKGMGATPTTPRRVPS